MPIDASIALQGRLPQIESPLNAIANVLKIKGAQQQSQLGELQLAEHQRTADENKAVNSAFSSALGPDGKIDRNRLYSTLATSGYGAKLPVLQKGFADQDKAAAEQKKAEIEAHLKKFEVAGQIMAGVSDQATWDRARTQTAQVFGPEAAAQMPAQYDPALVEQKRTQALSVKDQLEQGWKALDQKLKESQFGETVRHNGATESISVDNNKRTVNATLRGQNLLDARSRESNSAGRVPAGYRQKADGSLEFIPGGPADPNAAKRAAPTEFQGKAGMFGARAQEADRIITELGDKYSPTAINLKQAVGSTPLIGGALEAAGNKALSNESQKAEQAQRDFVNAVLRLESGAAISQGEFENARKQYFPQPGDAPAVIKQKAQNRKTAIQGLVSNARPGAVDASGGASGGWSIQKVN